MTAYRAIAGADIRPGMTISLKPGDTPFNVTRVEPGTTTDRLAYIWDGDRLPAEGAIFTEHWYAEVVSK